LPTRRSSDLDDTVFLTVDDFQIPFFIKFSNLPCLIPIAIKVFGRCFRIIVVTFHNAWAAYKHLSIISNFHIEVWQYFTDGACFSSHHRIRCNHGGCFCQTVSFENWQIKRPEKPRDFWVQRPAAGHHTAQPSALFFLYFLENKSVSSFPFAVQISWHGGLFNDLIDPSI